VIQRDIRMKTVNMWATNWTNKWALAIGVATVLAASVSTSALAQEVIIARPPPPPMRVEVVPVARPGYAWENGHWRWAGRGYAWVPGHWRGMGRMCPPGMRPGPYGRRCFR